MRRCVQEDEMYDVLRDSHSEPCGGQFADKILTDKVLHASYYWPTPFKDAKMYVSSCDDFQIIGRPVPSDEMPLQTHITIEPFEN